MTTKPDWGEINQALGNLLARVFADGGHYVQEHGWLKAIEDAEDIVLTLIVKYEKCRAEHDWLEQARLARDRGCMKDVDHQLHVRFINHQGHALYLVKDDAKGAFRLICGPCGTELECFYEEDPE